MEFKNLTITHYAAVKEEERRITMSPSNIALIAAKTEDVEINGRSLREVSVLFMDGESVDVVVNHSDLQLMEEAIGAYSLPF